MFASQLITPLVAPAGLSAARATACRARLACTNRRRVTDRRVVTRATQGGVSAEPIVHIDNLSDPLATVVDVSFGSVLGELLDTVQSLKNLGLNITRAEITEGENVNKFYITDSATSEKVTNSEKLEEIRLTILNNLVEFHPESAEFLTLGTLSASGNANEPDANPLGPRPPSVIKTSIRVKSEMSGSRSAVTIETTDRPGLLVDIVRTLKDLSLNVVSAEIDTMGRKAVDVVFVTHRGMALNGSMETLVINALQYYLSLAEVEKEESY